MAGGVGLEPTVRVLETRGLPINRPSSVLLIYFTLTTVVLVLIPNSGIYNTYFRCQFL